MDIDPLRLKRRDPDPAHATNSLSAR